MFKAIRLLYTNTLACMKINNYHTDWFEINNGVCQGDTLSPTLFSFFINDLATEVKELGLGVDINGIKICILLYADDMVLIADSKSELQSVLNIMYQWCKKWRLRLNGNKTKIVHFRGKRVKQCLSLHMVVKQ